MRKLSVTSNWTLILPAALVLSGTLAGAQTSPPAQPTGFHHLHLNSTDPPAAIAWYTKTFAVTSRATVAGFEGIATEKIHLLFTRTDKAPSSALDSAIWHFGWGSPDMPGDFAMYQTNGVKFATPLSKLAQGTVFAYMNAPDGALVEINSAQSRAFVHVHLYSEHPVCAADWYVTHLGAARRGAAREGPSTSLGTSPSTSLGTSPSTSLGTSPCEAPYAAPSEPLAVIRSPAATVRFDDISLIIYPRQRPGALVSSAGHVVDHLALSVADLAATVKRLEATGVKVLRGVHPFGSGQGKAALIEGPDSIVIELVEQP